MKLLLSVALLITVGRAQAQDCPDDAAFDISNFALPSGDACILCVPTMDTCGVKCGCLTTGMDDAVM